MAFLGLSVASLCLWNSFSLATSLLQRPMPILAVQLDAPKLQLPQAGRLPPFFLRLELWGAGSSSGCRAGAGERGEREGKRDESLLKGLPVLPSRPRWLTCSSRMTAL